MRVPGNCLAVANLLDRTVRYTTTRKTFSIDVLETDCGNKTKANKLITLHCVYGRALKASLGEFESLVDDGYFEGFVYLFTPWTGWSLLHP